MAEFELELFPSRKITLLLFHQVQNAVELRDKIVSHELPFDVGLINARMIIGLRQVLAAAHKALYNTTTERGLLTTSLHSELVYSFAGSRSISDAFRDFGIGVSSDRLLVGIFDATQDKVDQIKDMIIGDVVDIAQLDFPEEGDVAKVRNVYKLQDEEVNLHGLVDSIVMRIAVRDII